MGGGGNCVQSCAILEEMMKYLLYITIAAVLFGPGVAGEFAKKLLGL